MKREILNQYGHFWRTYRDICKGFETHSWKTLGFGITQPDRLALHILQSAIFYMEGRMLLVRKDGSLIDNHSSELEKDALPDVDGVLFMLETVEEKIEAWIRDMDFTGKNETYPWTGETALSVALFLLRHNQYHLGEMNALLNEQLHGAADDYFAKTL